MRHVELLRDCTDALQAYTAPYKYRLPRHEVFRVRFLTAAALTAEELQLEVGKDRAEDLALPLVQAIARALGREVGDWESEWNDRLSEWREALYCSALEEGWDALKELEAIVAKMAPDGGLPAVEAFTMAALELASRRKTREAEEALSRAEEFARKLPPYKPEKARAFAVLGAAYYYMSGRAEDEDDATQTEYRLLADKWFAAAMAAARAFSPESADRAYALLGVAEEMGRVPERREDVALMLSEVNGAWTSLDDRDKAYTSAAMARAMAQCGNYLGAVDALNWALTVAFTLPVIERVFALREIADAIAHLDRILSEQQSE